MTTIDPAIRLTSTYRTDDLRTLVDGAGPFATILLPTPSEHVGSDHRLDVHWRNGRRMLEGSWPGERLDELDRCIAALDHTEAEGFVVVQRADGLIHVEPLSSGLSRSVASVDDSPRLLEVIEDRQRTLPHVLVETDRVGATISFFDRGHPLASEQVDGDTEFIHRARGGGWSHRRFQQRAENTWERNAGDVAAAVAAMARERHPVVIAIAGEVRATQLLHDALDDEFGELIVDLDAGDADGIAEEMVRVLDDRLARFQVAVLAQLRDERGITDAPHVLAALDEGRVETLVVSGPPASADDEARRARSATVGTAIASALRTAAPIVVVPVTAETSDGLAAIVRW